MIVRHNNTSKKINAEFLRVFLAGNDSSCYAQIEALVYYHQTNINESKYNWTIDRVTIDEKDNSNKPPFSFILTRKNKSNISSSFT
jgi:hypothetical protein